MPWYVLYTKHRAEKKVAEALEKMEIETYCPIVTEVRQWSDRKKKVNVPLFTSYVFVFLKEKERKKVFGIPGVVRFLFWLGKPAIVKDVEIKTIKEWLEEANVDKVVVEHFSPGDKITISKGSFKNQEAIIRNIDPKRMRLLIPGLNCTVSLKIKEII